MNIKKALVLKDYVYPDLFLFGSSPFPLVVRLVVTYRCNLRCKTCKVWQKGQQEEAGLSVDEWKTVIGEIGSSFLVKPRIHFMGGEPLLHEGLLDLVDTACMQGMKCSMTTNGFFLDEYAESLIKSGIDQINVSIDGNREIHNMIRGSPLIFDKAVSGIEKLDELKKRLGSKTPSINVNCVISSYNFRQLYPIVKELESIRGVGYLSIQHPIFDNVCEEWIKGLDVDVLMGQIDRINRERHEIPVDFYPKIRKQHLAAYYSNDREFKGSCVMPFINLTVEPDGEVSICRVKLGNVGAGGEDIGVLWNSPTARNCRKEMKKAPLQACPRRCCHKRYGKPVK